MTKWCSTKPFFSWRIHLLDFCNCIAAGNGTRGCQQLQTTRTYNQWITRLIVLKEYPKRLTNNNNCHRNFWKTSRKKYCSWFKTQTIAFLVKTHTTSWLWWHASLWSRTFPPTGHNWITGCSPLLKTCLTTSTASELKTLPRFRDFWAFISRC